MHGDPVASVVLALAVILMAAKLGGDLATRVGQPAVLGELVMGVLVGNLPLLGVPWIESVKTDASIDMLARLGVLILLFEVGLESTVPQMLRVGGSALLVAVIGVAAPLALGWGVGALLLPHAGGYTHAFLGATLCATSVGITARVLQDLGRSQTRESRIILGAAVIDDVLGLLVLAVVSGAIAAAGAGGKLSMVAVGALVLKASVFLATSLALGVWLSPKVFSLASRLQARGVLLALGLSFCFLLAWLSSVIGLAPIVGAFAAGLILEDVNYRDFVDRGEHELRELMHPISAFLVPVFFVVMGMRTDLRALASLDVVGLAAALTVAAIVGKQVCGLGVLTPGVDRVTVGIGMVPRGEVGLIFANVGLSLQVDGHPVVSQGLFSALVMMVIATTLITPPALSWRLRRQPVT
jgi:Kef-type K+ transport system membrane component KefB